MILGRHRVSRLLAVFFYIALGYPHRAAASDKPSMYFLGIERRDPKQKKCESLDKIDNEIADKIKADYPSNNLITIKDNHSSPGPSKPGCVGRNCTQGWSTHLAEGSKVFGGYIEDIGNGQVRRCIWKLEYRFSQHSSDSSQQLSDCEKLSEQPTVENLYPDLSGFLRVGAEAPQDRSKDVAQEADYCNPPNPTTNVAAAANSRRTLALAISTPLLAIPIIALSVWGLTQHGQPNGGAMDCRFIDPQTGASRVLFGDSCNYATRDVSIAGLVLGLGVLPGAATALGLLLPLSRQSKPRPSR